MISALRMLALKSDSVSDNFKQRIRSDAQACTSAAKSSENVLMECSSLNKLEDVAIVEEQELNASPVCFRVLILIMLTRKIKFPKLSDENTNLKKDDRKFDELLAHFENRKRKTIAQISQEQQAILEFG